MQLQVKGKNVEVSDSIREYAEAKLRKLERQLADPTKVELELTVEKNPSIAESHVAEATIWTKGPTLRARESATDVRASIDLLVDKLERQVTRYREKRQRSRHGHGHGHAKANGVAPLPEGVPVIAGEEAPLIVKTKQFTVKPMSAEEAVLQLELVGHDFFVFRSDETDEVNVVYRRNDGNYGLIETQDA
jgi:putative sigma-54 modulation protein